MRALLVEDDPVLGDWLRAGLRQQGFEVDWVRTVMRHSASCVVTPTP